MVPTSPIRGDFPSLKLGRMVRYGSTIERDLLYFLEYRQAVTWYCEQPRTIEQILLDGQRHRYTPDYEVHDGTDRVLVECKPEALLETPHAQQQRQMGLHWAENNGYRFVTYTDTELRAGQHLNNLKLLWRYARLQDTTTAPRILAHLREQKHCTVDDLCDQFQLAPYAVMPQVCFLLFHHHLQIDLNQAFTTSRPFWLAESEGYGTHTSSGWNTLHP